MRAKNEAKSLEPVGCKCYRPGDPEFEAIAGRITPLHKIRSEVSNNYTVLNQEQTPDYHGRRNESVNSLYMSVHY